MKALLTGEAVGCLIALAIPMTTGLGETGDMYRSVLKADYPDTILVLTSFFGLSGFAMVSFVALLLAAKVLAITHRPYKQTHSGQTESPDGRSASDERAK